MHQVICVLWVGLVRLMWHYEKSEHNEKRLEKLGVLDRRVGSFCDLVGRFGTIAAHREGPSSNNEKSSQI